MKVGEEAVTLCEPAFVVLAAANVGSVRIMVDEVGGEQFLEKRDVSLIPALI
jgi:hypothetical protein